MTGHDERRADVAGGKRDHGQDRQQHDQRIPADVVESAQRRQAFFAHHLVRAIGFEARAGPRLPLSRSFWSEACGEPPASHRMPARQAVPLRNVPARLLNAAVVMHGAEPT